MAKREPEFKDEHYDLISVLYHALQGDETVGKYIQDAESADDQDLAEHFRDMGAGPVELWPLDNLLAIKIVLNRALQGGAARSLRMDNLGKAVAARLLRMEIEAPADLPRLRAP